MLVMDPTAKSKKPFLLLKPSLKLKKNLRLQPSAKERTLPLPGKKQKNIKNTLLPLIFQKINFQLISIGETLKELILLLNTEIKDIVALATPFLSLKLSNNV